VRREKERGGKKSEWRERERRGEKSVVVSKKKE
jgi:hypothetical protein